MVGSELDLLGQGHEGKAFGGAGREAPALWGTVRAVARGNGRWPFRGPPNRVNRWAQCMRIIAPCDNGEENGSHLGGALTLVTEIRK